jgi:ATP-binding cassette subfamily B protein
MNAQQEVVKLFRGNILFYGILILAMAFIGGIFTFLMRQTIIVMSRHIEFDLKNEIYTHYQRLSLGFYRKNNTGDLMARISEDVGRVRMYIGPAIMYGINLVVLFVLAISYMISVNAELTIYVLLPLPILSITIFYVNTLIEKKSDLIQQSLSRMSTFTQEAFSGIRVIKAFVREKDMTNKLEKESLEYRKRSLSLTKVNSVFNPVVLSLIGLSTLLTIFIGGMQVIEGKITPGNIAEFVIYVNMLAWPVTSLGWTMSLVKRAEASQQRINDFLLTPEDVPSGKLVPLNLNGDIQFQNVSFTYADSGITALKNIDFEVKSGECLAILGATGSGKSTIANLLCRMYDPDSGKVLLDNSDLKNYDLGFVRSQIGYVPQDVFLFSDSIRNNIAFGKDDFTDEEIQLASELADLSGNVNGFQDKFETMLGERGITLSGGQKQRVSIARAIIKNPKIMILDDCLSAVDTKTEHTILNNLQKIMKGKTTIIISHRVSSAKMANKIVVLEQGCIIESGSHDELLKKNGLYCSLYEKQWQTEDNI